jgi:nucleoside permease NupC
MVAADETAHNVGCFLCSAEVDGNVTGSVRAFAGNIFLNGYVGGNVLVFGGNLTLTSHATIGGHVFIFGGHFRQDSTGPNHPHTVFPPIIFLPVILVICAIFGVLIVVARRMARGPVAYPHLPRL